ncbi:MAG: transcriptional repressor LexA, partial [Myxococcota bacterium]
MQGLTARQEQVLRFIRQSIVDRGYPPTLREIGAHMGIRSTNGVNDHLRALERKGYLTREDMKSRALRPVDMGPAEKTSASSEARAIGESLQQTGLPAGPANDGGADIVSIPILGRVAAGSPLYADEHLIDTVRIDQSMLRSGEIFGLQVTGDSMIEAGIHSGDYVFVRKQSHADRGEIVVALIGDEA